VHALTFTAAVSANIAGLGAGGRVCRTQVRRGVDVSAVLSISSDPTAAVFCGRSAVVMLDHTGLRTPGVGVNALELPDMIAIADDAVDSSDDDDWRVD